MAEINLDSLWKIAENEANWLKYYGHVSTRMTEEFTDAYFYDRMISIGYAKVPTPLHLRCAMGYITSDKPVLESEPMELKMTSGPRNHEKNVYTCLEYFVGTRQMLDEIKSIIKK